MFSFFKKQPHDPPSRNQLALCKRLGLEVKPGTSRKKVSKLLGVSLRQDKYKRIYEEIQREKEAESEKEERAMYGDDLYDDQKRWERYCGSDQQYLLVFKRGGKIQSDVVEFASADMIGEKKFSLQLGVLLPKRHKDNDSGDWVEWEKDIILKPGHVLKIEALSKPIEIFDVERYQDTKARCDEMAAKLST